MAEAGVGEVGQQAVPEGFGGDAGTVGDEEYVAGLGHGKADRF